MDVSGSIRRSSDGVDISLRNYEGRYERLRQGPLTEVIRAFYDLLLSSSYRRNVGGKTYIARTFVTLDGEEVKHVTFTLQGMAFTLTRYPRDYNGIANPSDKVNMKVTFPTIGSIVGDNAT
jgi:hypothetical protein